MERSRVQVLVRDKDSDRQDVILVYLLLLRSWRWENTPHSLNLIPEHTKKMSYFVESKNSTP